MSRIHVLSPSFLHRVTLEHLQPTFKVAFSLVWMACIFSNCVQQVCIIVLMILSHHITLLKLKVNTRILHCGYKHWQPYTNVLLFCKFKSYFHRWMFDNPENQSPKYLQSMFLAVSFSLSTTETVHWIFPSHTVNRTLHRIIS